MSAVLGLAISGTSVRAVLGVGGTVAWAGTACYQDASDLAEVIARLAAESGKPVRRARVALERDLVQLRTLMPAPPLRAGAVRRYVALEAARLFRKSDAPLVTDAALVPVTRTDRALWAAAAPEALLRTILGGCAEAGLHVEALGPAADVLPSAVRRSTSPVSFPNGGASEVLEVGPEGTWRSRRVRGCDGSLPDWVPALASLGEEARHFAAAYGATVRAPRLLLLPPEAQLARECSTRRRLAWLGCASVALWALAAGIYGARLVGSASRAERELNRLAPAIDSALAVRRELTAARATLGLMAHAERARSRHLVLLADLTRSLRDSSFLVALRLAPDGTLRLGGYAPVAARALADLEQVAALRNPKFEGPVTREVGHGARELDRFAIVGRVEVER